MNKGIIYAIKCKENKKHYVGATCAKMYVRWANHKCLLKKGKHYRKDMQADWSSYGEAGFEVIELEKCDRGLMAKKEKEWIDNLGSVANGYNRERELSYYTQSDVLRRIGRPSLPNPNMAFWASVPKEVYYALVSMRDDDWIGFKAMISSGEGVDINLETKRLESKGRAGSGDSGGVVDKLKKDNQVLLNEVGRLSFEKGLLESRWEELKARVPSGVQGVTEAAKRNLDEMWMEAGSRVVGVTAPTNSTPRDLGCAAYPANQPMIGSSAQFEEVDALKARVRELEVENSKLKNLLGGENGAIWGA